MNTKQPTPPGTKVLKPTKAKAVQAATWAKGSLARIYQGVANGLLVFGKKSPYGD